MSYEQVFWFMVQEKLLGRRYLDILLLKHLIMDQTKAYFTFNLGRYYPKGWDNQDGLQIFYLNLGGYYRFFFLLSPIFELINRNGIDIVWIDGQLTKHVKYQTATRGKYCKPDQATSVLSL